jgi:hypothetical protein
MSSTIRPEESVTAAIDVRGHDVSELPVASSDPRDGGAGHVQAIDAVRQPPVVITEQEVVFSTAAAVPMPRTKPTRTVSAALRALFLRSPRDARPKRQYCPPLRPAFMEQAEMSREMFRL